MISCPTNRGKGYALKKALSWLRDRVREGNTIVTLDCDGQHNLEGAVRLSGTATTGSGCAVSGN